MTPADRAATVSVTEVDLLVRISAHERAMRLAGHDLRRARRILAMGLLEPGRLSDRHFKITAKGQSLVDQVSRA